jgi:hypothetical protein
MARRQFRHGKQMARQSEQCVATVAQKQCSETCPAPPPLLNDDLLPPRVTLLYVVATETNNEWRVRAATRMCPAHTKTDFVRTWDGMARRTTAVVIRGRFCFVPDYCGREVERNDEPSIAHAIFATHIYPDTAEIFLYVSDIVRI